MSSQASKRARIDYEDSEFDSQRVKTQTVESVNWDDEEIERKVKALCRYVLACEYKKTTIRRENINKLIIPDSKRIFSQLLQRANLRLRKVFGYELQEATLRDKVDFPQDMQTQGEPSAQQTQQTQQTQRQSTGGASGVYFLRNIMKEHYILPEIVKRPKEEYIQTGILYVVLALLFVNEYQMNSRELNEHLDRLKITSNGVGELDEREKIFDSFVKYQYLKRTKTDEQEEEEIEYTYQWGARAYAELPCQNMVEFISSFYNLDESEKEDFHHRLYQAGGYSLQK